MPTAQAVALITGAAARIGAAMARHFHSHGFRIVIHYQNSEAKAQKLAQELNQQRQDSCVILKADLNCPEEVEQLASSALAIWQRLDVLINNASRFYPTPVGESTTQQWQDLMSSNLQAPFFLSQALAPALKNSKGCIINMADIHSEKPMVKHSIYNIAKAGNAMLTKTLALELAPDIRVNGIAPGAILWPDDVKKEHDKKNKAEGEDKKHRTILDKIPLQDLGGTDAICKAALYLATQAHYSTGQILNIDGGRSLNM